MGKTGITGSVICVLSALAIAAALILPKALPARFGGPNIGAGLLFYAAIAVGVVGLVLLLVDRVRGRRTD